MQDLIEDLKSELSSNFEQVILGLMTPTVLYDVQELRRAMKVGGLLELLVFPVHMVMSYILQKHDRQSWTTWLGG